MRIYIVEDDVSVISILEDIVEREGLGSLCGDTGEYGPDLEEILAIDPDIILIDLLMPGKTGMVRFRRSFMPILTRLAYIRAFCRIVIRSSTPA